MRIAYLGPKGTFSEEAATRYFTEDGVESIMCSTILDVLEAVDEGRVDKGIVPIENALEGTITMTTDGLIHHDLWIEGEAVLPIRLQLLGNPGAKLEDIKEVWSIPPALAQCRMFTRNLKAETKHYSSTAAAAEAIQKEGKMDAGAIASEWAGKTFGLEVIQPDIHDNACNSTRFVIIRKAPVERTAKGAKSMLLVTPTEDRPGLLAIILNVFSSLGINLTWIESRPTKKRLGTYRFFIETAAGVEDTQLQKAKTILETYGYDVRTLGSYMKKDL
ncbi:prephenate dehydratase [Lederbergia sp. NSJ-179]|uniref:prephenate dehydratase n=1 Tax=Lederbergia sp. NSJ-179 TaxID=2931402 RepID=UPI001FD236A2|nr:prephenate dehydratase [Lederbergia sp. NSJ-179]MCJ7842424.1 prephenate dehydratase [Lederbergia sp. NSJ-179]